MKLTITLLFGLLLAIAPALAGPSRSVCAVTKHHAQCDCGGKMSCCARPSVPHSDPEPLTIPNSGSQNLISVPAASDIGRLLPDGEVAFLSNSFTTRWITGNTPLFQRNCALLI